MGRPSGPGDFPAGKDLIASRTSSGVFGPTRVARSLPDSQPRAKGLRCSTIPWDQNSEAVRMSKVSRRIAKRHWVYLGTLCYIFDVWGVCLSTLCKDILYCEEHNNNGNIGLWLCCLILFCFIIDCTSGINVFFFFTQPHKLIFTPCDSLCN